MATCFHSPVKEWLWIHPWWHRFLLAIPAIALALIAFVELRRSEKANELRDEVNRLLGETFPTFWPAAVFFPLTGKVCQQMDEVKTAESRRDMSIDACPLNVLKAWKQTTQFPKSEDWMFASPVQLGGLPGPTIRSGVCTRKQRRRQESEHSGRTVFVTRIVPGWIR